MKKIVLVFALLAAVLIPMAAKADGGIMPPPNYWIHETDQKAVIVSENGVETLVLSTSFQGDAKDFAWIVPTPSKPEVMKGAVKIFEALEDYTRVSYGDGRIYNSLPLGLESSVPAPAVNVIEEKKIGIYDITVLEANDKEALYTWLKEKGYNYPEYGKTILDDYIQNRWFFTAVKINSQDLAYASVDLKSGTITPLKLVFATDKIVYPLKISSITMANPKVNGDTPVSSIESSSSSGTATNTKEIVAVPPNTVIPSNYMDVKLYVFADHKKQIDGFTTKYANWVDAKTISGFALDDNGNAWYSPKKEMFLTVLYDNMSTRDMKTDVFLTNAQDNDTIPPSQFWVYVLATIAVLLIIIISPFGLFYIILMLLVIFLRSKITKIFFLLFQGIIALFGVVVSIVLSFELGQGYSDPYSSLPVLIAAALTTVAMVVGMVLEIVLGKKKGKL
ncbi:MAG TPA: DUF2330 domain-containing protein [Patescibacteria group bacterium]|nr:DUF2330 domain-containing protein [Patescibacteria group bacterium]